jgi:hypothetical protein
MYRFLSRICAKFGTGYTLNLLHNISAYTLTLPLIKHINRSSQFLSSFVHNAYICSYQLKINTMKKVKQDWSANSYTPALAVDDAKRKQWFTTYNIALVNRIREIKLNQIK